MKTIVAMLMLLVPSLIASNARADNPPPFVSTWGTSGSGNGQFGDPQGIAIDASGSVYVADFINHRIQKFDSAGNFLTKWGSLGSAEGQFDYPDGVATDASGNVYVADRVNNRIQKFSGSGSFIAAWGWGVRTGTPVYEICTSGCRAGISSCPPACVGDGLFQSPLAVATDASGNVYVVDASSGIQKFTSTGTFLANLGGFGRPVAVATDASGNVYISDYNIDRAFCDSHIEKFASDGTFLEMWGWGVATGTAAFERCTSNCKMGICGTGDGQFGFPNGLAVDADGNVYVADVSNDRIQKLDSAGNFLTKWGADGTAEGQFHYPVGVALNVNGNVYVLDSGNNRVQVFGSGIPLCPPVPMSFDFSPDALNLKSQGQWVTATLEPGPPASPSDIDIASIRLNGGVPVDVSATSSIGDADHDHLPDLTVRFNRVAFELTVPAGDAVPVTVAGKLGDGCFEAADTIRVVHVPVTAPSAGSVLQSGSAAEVRWDTPNGIQVQSVALLSSSDDGATWNLVAHELPNTGSAQWMAPGTATDQARIAVVLVESADESGYEVTGVVGVSDRFAIASPLAVGPPRVELALQGSVPNPGSDLSVSFSLPDARPARLVVYDVSGREISRREVGNLGAGRHVVTLGAPERLASGIYLVHLVHGDRRLVARAVVVQ